MHLRLKYTHRLKVNGWEKIFHISGKGKKAGVAVLISDKKDFKIKASKRQRRTIHKYKRNNPTRSYNRNKYLGAPT